VIFILDIYRRFCIVAEDMSETEFKQLAKIAKKRLEKRGVRFSWVALFKEIQEIMSGK
jgi:hypothetical protein